MIASRLIWLYNLRLRLDVLKNSFVTRTTMTKPLSPAAQSVLDAYWKSPWDPSLQHEDRYAIAAALRAAADQVHMDTALGNTDADAGVFAAHHAINAHLLAIAAELEEVND
jgi:formiminotetrahydrofolate cyclodeaminase